MKEHHIHLVHAHKDSPCPAQARHSLPRLKVRHLQRAARSKRPNTRICWRCAEGLPCIHFIPALACQRILFSSQLLQTKQTAKPTNEADGKAYKPLPSINQSTQSCSPTIPYMEINLVHSPPGTCIWTSALDSWKTMQETTQPLWHTLVPHNHSHQTRKAAFAFKISKSPAALFPNRQSHAASHESPEGTNKSSSNPSP